MMVINPTARIIGNLETKSGKPPTKIEILVIKMEVLVPASNTPKSALGHKHGSSEDGGNIGRIEIDGIG